MTTQTTIQLSVPTVRELPLASVGLDPRPERQVRALDLGWVRHLVDETDPAEWDPIQVRCWPAGDPYPPDEDGREWQVISGYHRTSAARVLGMTTIRAVVAEAETDADFTLLAIKGNLRHGKPMSTDEQRAAVQRLRALGMSEGDIAGQIGIPKGTVHNWLSARNTNTARSVRTHQTDGNNPRGGEDGDELDAAWRVVPAVRPDARRLARVSSTVHDFLAGTPSGAVEPSDVLAWVATLAPDVRRSLAGDVRETMAWLANLHEVLGMPGGLSGGETRGEGAA